MRPMIQFLQNKFGSQNLIAAEVGVLRGCHAQNILDSLLFKQLFLIDIWDSMVFDPRSVENTPIKKTKKNVAFDIFYPEVIKKFKTRSDVTILRKTSTEASKEFLDGVFDFVYLDACHKYDFVKEDIKNWFPKIKVGGVIGGHDYEDKGKFGVKKAVHEFVRKTNCNLYYKIPDWWININEMNNSKITKVL